MVARLFNDDQEQNIVDMYQSKDMSAQDIAEEKGRFTYDGEEFDSVGGEGSSSYTHFYKDGEEVC